MSTTESENPQTVDESRSTEETEPRKEESEQDAPASSEAKEDGGPDDSGSKPACDDDTAGNTEPSTADSGAGGAEDDATPPPREGTPESEKAPEGEAQEASKGDESGGQEEPELSEEEKDRLNRQRLQARKAELEAQAQELEEKHKAANLINRANHMNEKADEIDEKTLEAKKETKKMQKEVQAFRNSDRVMVNLRDTAQNMKKHYRMRDAHIRQKEATIELIDQRSKEQIESSHELLQVFRESLRELIADTKRYDEQNVLANRTDPMRCAAAILKRDAEDEAFLEAVERHCAYLEKQDRAVTSELHQAKNATGDKAALTAAEKDRQMAEAQRLWSWEKEQLALEYENAERLQREAAFHVRRGTNIKSFEVLNTKAPSIAVEELRRLNMIHEEALLEVKALTKERDNLQSQRSGVTTRRDTDVRDTDRLHANLKKQRQALEEQNQKLRDRYAVLQRSANGGGASGTDGNSPVRYIDNRSMTSVTSAATTSRSTPSKLKFTPDVLARLQKPTKAQQSHMLTQQEEEDLRQSIIRRMHNKRPNRT